MSLSFDELLEVAARREPAFEVEIKSLGRKVWVRNPSSADVDDWRMWCSRNQATGRPMAAKLVQILLSDETGRRVIPQTDEALDRLADTDPKVVDEIAKFALTLVNEPTDEAIEDEKKG